MIVGSYILDLYCDSENCNNIKFQHQYVEETGGRCRKKAREDGWSIYKGKAICPLCNSKNRKSGK